MNSMGISFLKEDMYFQNLIGVVFRSSLLVYQLTLSDLIHASDTHSEKIIIMVFSFTSPVSSMKSLSPNIINNCVREPVRECGSLWNC
jgi:hypothetical protein